MNRNIVQKQASNNWFYDDCRKERAEYLKCKQIHSKTRSEVTENEFKALSINFKRVLKNAKSTYYGTFQKKVRYLQCSNQRMFWKPIKKANSYSNAVNNIPIQTFSAHFKNLHEKCCGNDDNNRPCHSSSSVIEELNKPLLFLQW